MLKPIVNALVAFSLVATSADPVSAQQFIFRYRMPVVSNPSDVEVPEEEAGYGIGNDITFFFTGAVGYEFSKVIPVATRDVVEWRRISGSYQPGLSLYAETGILSGVASGTTAERKATLMGYDAHTGTISPARITFNFHDPVGKPQKFSSTVTPTSTCTARSRPRYP